MSALFINEFPPFNTLLNCLFKPLLLLLLLLLLFKEEFPFGISNVRTTGTLFNC